MSYLEHIKNTARESFRLKLDWTGSYKAFKKFREDAENNDGKLVVVGEKVGNAEIKKRYKMKSYVCYAALAGFSYSFISIPLSNNFNQLLYAILCTVVMGMLYYRNAYSLWVSRQWYVSGKKIENGDKLGNKEFIEAICEDAKNLLPRGL